MRAKLLKILRRDAEKRISVEYRQYCTGEPGTFIVKNGQEVVYAESFKAEHRNYKRYRQEAFKLANELRREWILIRLKTLK